MFVTKQVDKRAERTDDLTRVVTSAIICETVQSARRALGLSIEQLASSIDKSEDFVRLLESGQQGFDDEILLACAKAFDLDISELYELAAYGNCLVLESCSD